MIDRHLKPCPSCFLIFCPPFICSFSFSLIAFKFLPWICCFFFLAFLLYMPIISFYSFLFASLLSFLPILPFSSFSPLLFDISLTMLIMFCHLRRISFIFLLLPFSLSLSLPHTPSLFHCVSAWRRFQAGQQLPGNRLHPHWFRLCLPFSLSSSFMGLTAVMCCWLLVTWSLGGHPAFFLLRCGDERLQVYMGSAW